MPDDVDVDQGSLVVDLVYHPVIADSDAPKVARSPEFSATTRTRRLSESFDSLQYSLGDTGG